jgi:glycosyltransferase involved in cell wall biosynthesis
MFKNIININKLFYQMKYPKILFFRLDKYSEIDTFINKNINEFECDIEITSDSKMLENLFTPDYHILATFGELEQEYYGVINSIIVPRINKRWIHFKEIVNIKEFSRGTTFCYIHNVIGNRESLRPEFSLFTTCYNSYDKIVRAYKSIRAQTLRDWEWVIIDDSPDENHFKFLNDLLGNDKKVRLYKRNKNSGNIGNVKNEAIGLCRGKYLLEMDHDDEITEDLLRQSVSVFENYPEVGFIYTNFVNIYENGNNFKYDDFYGKGYCAYYCENYKGRWVYVSSVANVNNITSVNLICMPNHPRIWRRDVLYKIGSYCELLPINDDQEILLRTVLGTKIAKIHINGYLQYMNEGSNNFSLIRNYEINKIGPKYLYPQFYNMYNFHDEMKKADAYEDEKYIYHNSPIWKRENYDHKYCNLIINTNYKKQICIIGINALVQNLENIQKLYEERTNDFILLENTHNPMFWCRYLDYYGFSRMKCYSLSDCTYDELKKYFLLTYKSCDDYEFITHSIINLSHNTNLSSRKDIIESITNKEMKYLEIGVEYGTTFKDIHFINKTGVDPDPKFESDKLVKLTSDDFFVLNKETFDIVFIDGMHQTEYVLNDFNNSVKCLNDNGIIFIDDVLPINYNEQKKIPNLNYYENNILKYREPWTGDVWKVFYWILINFSDKIKVKYYNNSNYRGVACIHILEKFQINSEDINTINKLDYFEDHSKYLELLKII